MTREPDPLDFLYAGAQRHVSTWKPGRLEQRSAVLHSSQALCISVFGTLDGHPKGAEIIRAICSHAGLQVPSGTPGIECEVRSHPELLNEYGARNPTCPDVLLRWPQFVLTVESKFREHLSGCSQAKPPKRKRDEPKDAPRKPPACTGNHEVGSDVKTKTDATCRLTIQEGERTPRRYWELGSDLFEPDVLVTPRSPCPFKDGTYQLMRNLCFAAAYAAKEKLPSFGFIVAYVGAAEAAKDTRAQLTEFGGMLRPSVRRSFGAITYEEVATILARLGEVSLANWITNRIPVGLQARRPA